MDIITKKLLKNFVIPYTGGVMILVSSFSIHKYPETPKTLERVVQLNDSLSQSIKLEHLSDKEELVKYSKELKDERDSLINTTTYKNESKGYNKAVSNRAKKMFSQLLLGASVMVYAMYRGFRRASKK